jgi:hypothetical protein
MAGALLTRPGNAALPVSELPQPNAMAADLPVPSGRIDPDVAGVKRLLGLAQRPGLWNRITSAVRSHSGAAVAAGSVSAYSKR